LIYDKHGSKSDIPRLKHRARLMNNAIYLAVSSGICTTVLVILAFASAPPMWKALSMLN
jgi:Protein of unknown function (DUF2721)